MTTNTALMNKRVEITVTGRVQGVGFRPTVYRYATECGLYGSVKNSPTGVIIELEGAEKDIERLLKLLTDNPPPQAGIDNISIHETSIRNEDSFKIIESLRSGDLTAGMPPDIASCDECVDELMSPDNRRFRYPFINCTNCGPRFTIINRLPYDREETSMSSFEMCDECSKEYHDPTSRRFDAQPNACSKCGPSCKLISADAMTVKGDPVTETIKFLNNGAIIAIKGLGGYHLACNATKDEPVRLLRERKRRTSKPFAIMFPSIMEVKEHCHLNPDEEAELLSPARPIVILKTRHDSKLTDLVAPDTEDTGAFLPYTPLHHLILSETGPLVMTSCNFAEEPIISEEEQLNSRILGKIADYALIHDREILRPCDDSVARSVEGSRMVLRRSRGIVPDHIIVPDGPSVLACGGELKNTFCITRGPHAFMSQHIGDLSDITSFEFYKEQIKDLTSLLETDPSIIAHDLHPDYLSTRYALSREINAVAVQHHHAHIASCMAENKIYDQVIGVALDGTGYGPDNTIWGGEFLISDLNEYRRAAHFKQYMMPGGEEAIKNPERMAFSYLLSEMGPDMDRVSRLLPGMKSDEACIIQQMLEKQLQCPLTSSAGRLFDAVAALLGTGGVISYEGQYAIKLQAMAKPDEKNLYDFDIQSDGEPYIVSFGPTVKGIIADLNSRKDLSVISGMFHNTVAEAVAKTCSIIRDKGKINKVALSGGVFQNSLLLSLVINNLKEMDFEVFHHRLLPPNDGGISLGQAVIAANKIG